MSSQRAFSVEGKMRNHENCQIKQVHTLLVLQTVNSPEPLIQLGQSLCPLRLMPVETKPVMESIRILDVPHLILAAVVDKSVPEGAHHVDGLLRAAGENERVRVVREETICTRQLQGRWGQPRVRVYLGLLERAPQACAGVPAEEEGAHEVSRLVRIHR